MALPVLSAGLENKLLQFHFAQLMQTRHQRREMRRLFVCGQRLGVAPRLYGVLMADGPLAGLLARAVVGIDKAGRGVDTRRRSSARPDASRSRKYRTLCSLRP